MQVELIRSKRLLLSFGLAAATIVCAVGGLLPIGELQASPPQRRARAVLAAPMAVNPQPVAEINDKAILKTDADLEALLVKAERYLEEGNYRIATRIWQEVIGRCGDTLYSSDEEMYYSVGRQVEKRIAQLPPDGLRTYRISADAGAAEILAALGPSERTAALQRIINEYFLSSAGDDAALELAGLALDHLDFVGAARLLQRIADDYPDPSVEMDLVWLRLAVCQAYVGDKAAADAALQRARELSNGQREHILRRVEADVHSVADRESVHAAQSDQYISARLGGKSRTGLMPALPASVMQSDLQPIFEYRIEPKRSSAEIHGPLSLGQAVVGNPGDKFPSDEVEQTLYSRWTEKEMMPAGFLVTDERHVYFKSLADVTAWDKSATSAEVVWRPAWLNQFVLDDGTRLRLNLQNAYGGRGSGRREQLSDDAEVYLFGDLIAQSMSLHQGVLYNVEGPSYDVTDTRAPRPNNPGNFQWGQQPRRTRTNFLSAYDARTGQVLWRIPATKTPREPATQDTAPENSADAESEAVDDDIGFMAAPIGYGPLLLVPVNVGGSIYIYALDSRQQGKMVWRSYLTDEPAGGANYWAPIQLAVDGSDLFAVCGSGALFVLEPATGMVRFARRYPRTGVPDRALREYGIAAELMILSGWSEDIALPYRNVILVLASDLNMIHAYDRQDGRLRWEAPLEAEPDQGVSYLIGVHNDMLYAGGSHELIAYDLKGEGRMVWTASWTARDYLKDAKSYGRGMLTSDAIYLPVRDSILKLDLRTGEPLGRVGVRLGFEGPLGNLFSDGEKIWVVCANRLLALGNVPPEPPATEGEADEAESTDADTDDNGF